MKSLLILLMVTASFSVARADEFDTIGPACIPDEDSLNNYFINGVTLQQSGTMTTALATFYCPIPQNITTPSHLYMMYSSSENNANTFVKATYMKMHKVTKVRTPIVTASSTAGINDNNIRTVEPTFSDTYDPTTFAYYVVVTMKRRNATQLVRFWLLTVW